MTSIQIEYFQTPFGELILGSFDEKLCLCDWRYRRMRDVIDHRIQSGLNCNYSFEGSTTIESCKEQLSEYLAGNRWEFSIPLLLIGTDFQQKIWQTLQNIPYGTTLSYLELARKAGNESAIRAVAAANGANAISIIIPCHRIIGSNGELTGYAGGLRTKQKLLQLEKAMPFQGELEF